MDYGVLCMNCKKITKMIPDFLADNLENSELKDFLEHIEHCEECKEELTIEVLVNEGLNSLENGTNFDLKKEYINKISLAQNNLHRRELMKSIYLSLCGLVTIAVLILMLLIVFL